MGAEDMRKTVALDALSALSGFSLTNRRYQNLMEHADLFVDILEEAVHHARQQYATEREIYSAIKNGLRVALDHGLHGPPVQV